MAAPTKVTLADGHVTQPAGTSWLCLFHWLNASCFRKSYFSFCLLGNFREKSFLPKNTSEAYRVWTRGYFEINLTITFTVDHCVRDVPPQDLVNSEDGCVQCSRNWCLPVKSLRRGQHSKKFGPQIKPFWSWQLLGGAMKVCHVDSLNMSSSSFICLDLIL